MSEQSGQELPHRGWRDDPITAVSEDRLGRAPVAQRAARLIAENHTPESSVVYGLEGPWGSGKTSVIALLTTYLTEDRNRGDEWRVVSFTPWATTGTEGLLSEFFAALSTVAPEKSGDKVRNLIASYADIARPFVSLIPVAGSAVVEASRTLEHRLAKPWNVAFDDLAVELRNLHTPVLVVVDDIDRLQPTELLDLLKVVRLLGRFPGVDFLLAYDEQTLIETLQSPGHGSASKARARSFMEKIVQYSLVIPPLLTSKIVRMLSTGLTEIVTPERVEAHFDRHRFNDIILSTMPAQLATPRAVERFLAQVREQFRVHDLDEMNDVDLILATFLRVQFPDVFAQLQSHKADLTKSRGPHNSLRQYTYKQPDWAGLVGVLEGNGDRRDALAVMEAIFPAVRDKSPSRARPGRFAHPDYFDRYLAQAIPEGDIPDSIIDLALHQAAAGQGGALHALLTDEDAERLALALSKILDRFPDIGEEQGYTGRRGEVTLHLLHAVMTLVDATGDDRLTALVSTGDQLRWWSATLLRQLLHTEPTCAVDEALLRCANMQRRAHVLHTATRNLEGLPEATKEALNAAMEREVDRILPLLLDDLCGRDQSDPSAGIGYLYNLVAESAQLDQLRSRIVHGLATNHFTLEDVAARFVGLGYVIGGSDRPTSASFDGEVFTKVTGVGARSASHQDRAEWPDTSWASRRQFAAQFITPSLNDPTDEADPVVDG